MVSLFSLSIHNLHVCVTALAETLLPVLQFLHLGSPSSSSKGQQSLPMPETVYRASGLHEVPFSPPHSPLVSSS